MNDEPQNFFVDAPAAEAIDLINCDRPLSAAFLEGDIPANLRRLQILLENTRDPQLLANRVSADK